MHLDLNGMRERAIKKQESVVRTETMLKIFSLVESEEYRKKISRCPYYSRLSEITLSARIDIREKLNLLSTVVKECESDFRNCYKDSLEDLKKLEVAVKLMENESNDILFSMRKKWLDENGDIQISECPYSFKTFEYAVNEIKKNNADVESEDDGPWYIITRNKGTAYSSRNEIRYLVGCKGTVWKFQFFRETAEDNGFSSINHGEHWNIFFAFPGDIITIDGRPFHKPFHALSVNDGEEMAIFVENDFVKQMDIECCRVGFESFSPALRIERYKGDLHGDEKILSELSEKMKNGNDKFGVEVYNAIYEREHDMNDEFKTKFYTVDEIRKKFLCQ